MLAKKHITMIKKEIKKGNDVYFRFDGNWYVSDDDDSHPDDEGLFVWDKEGDEHWLEWEDVDEFKIKWGGEI